MKFRDIIYEDVISEEQIKEGGFLLQVSPHFWERMEEKHVNPTVVRTMLRRLPRIRRQIETIETHTQFNVYDSVTHTHIGMMRSETPGKLLVNTTYVNARYTGLNPVLKVR